MKTPFSNKKKMALLGLGALIVICLAIFATLQASRGVSKSESLKVSTSISKLELNANDCTQGLKQLSGTNVSRLDTVTYERLLGYQISCYTNLGSYSQALSKAAALKQVYNTQGSSAQKIQINQVIAEIKDDEQNQQSTENAVKNNAPAEKENGPIL